MGFLTDYRLADIQRHMDEEQDRNVKDKVGIHRQRAHNVQILCTIIDELGGGGVKLENNIVDNNSEFNQVEFIETFYRKIRFVDDFTRQLFLARAISETNNNNRKSRVAIRNLLETVSVDLNEYVDLYNDFIQNSGVFRKQHNFKESKANCEYLKQNEWITVYRGFNTRHLEEIRSSNNKKQSAYYRQKEGMGFSFTLNKKVAFLFSILYQARLLRSTSGYGFNVSHNDMKEEIHKHRSSIGRASIGRYVIHRDNIKCMEFGRSESEVMCDYRDAKLIDYKFLSDLNLNSKELSQISQGEMLEDQMKQLDKMKDSKIYKWWKTDYKVKKDIESLLLKTKK
tara:strand:- start:124 stop:1143 length:1020 start_codon:yes stop_codon:yes gene_type:complete